MHPSMILPSPSGPFWCWQTLETADMRPSYLHTATRSPPHETTHARFSGMLSTLQTDTYPLLTAARPLSLRLSNAAEARCRAVIVVNPAARTAASNGLVSDCSAPSVTCAISSPYAT